MITLHLPLIDNRKGFGIRAQISLWKSTLFLINPLRTCMAFDFMDNNNIEIWLDLPKVTLIFKCTLYAVFLEFIKSAYARVKFCQK